MIDTVYLSQREKDQLLKIKRATGIQNWNILCRWALCLSLSDKTQPPAIESTGDHAIEMTWKVFGGQDNEIFLALLKENCNNSNVPPSKENMSRELRAHLRRGISQLVAEKKVNSIASLVRNFQRKYQQA
jgi:DNA sulfur modification protein DndE